MVTKMVRQFTHHPKRDPGSVAVDKGSIKGGGKLGAVHMLVEGLEGGKDLKLGGAAPRVMV